jgi:dihydroxyacetone kinase-like predicted kinase
MVLLLDSLHAAISGGEPSEEVGPLGPLARAGSSEAAPRIAPRTSQKYEVQFLLDAEDGEIPGLRLRLGELGDSLVIVGGGGTFRVHVHTNHPDQVIEGAEAAGGPGSVSVTDLQGDVERCLVGQVRGVRTMQEQTSALVAIADGDGIRRILESLGALVVRGGPGDNPSVSEILQAVDSAPSGSVLVLPNHPNVVPAAEAAATQTTKDVRIVRSLSVPQGVSAAAAFHPDADPDTNERALADAAADCVSGEIARAVRDAETPAGHVADGQFLAMVEGRAVSVDDDAESLAAALVERLRDGRHEVLTVFAGAGVQDEAAAALERRLRDRFADLEIEFHTGGQPGSPYLIGLE